MANGKNKSVQSQPHYGAQSLSSLLLPGDPIRLQYSLENQNGQFLRETLTCVIRLSWAAATGIPVRLPLPGEDFQGPSRQIPEAIPLHAILLAQRGLELVVCYLELWPLHFGLVVLGMKLLIESVGADSLGPHLNTALLDLLGNPTDCSELVTLLMDKYLFPALVEGKPTPRNIRQQVYKHKKEPQMEARAPCGYVGLKNAGATCYMNAVLQQLFLTPGIREALMEVEDAPVGSVLYQVQMIFGHLQSSTLQFYVPDGFWRTMTMYGAEVNVREHQDAFEFFTHLLDLLDKALKDLDKPALSNRFRGYFLDCKVCQDCQHRKEREEEFTAISVTAKGTLEESLSQYVMQQKLDGEDAYFCEICSQKRNAVKNICIKTLPKTLVVHLKRFGYDIEAQCSNKCNDYFRLMCVISRGRWFKFNDTQVEEVEMIDELLETECFGGEFEVKPTFDPPEIRLRYWNAYILLYESVEEILPVRPSHTLNSSRLSDMSIGAFLLECPNVDMRKAFAHMLKWAAREYIELGGELNMPRRSRPLIGRNTAASRRYRNAIAIETPLQSETLRALRHLRYSEARVAATQTMQVPVQRIQLWTHKPFSGMLHTTLVPIDLESSGEFIFIRYHDFCNMGGERLTLQVEQTIRTLSKEGNSYSVIVKKLKAEGLDVGKATICRVVNGIGKKREAESNGQKFQVDRPRPVRTPATVSKVKRLATTENPPSQRQLSRMCGTSLKTINNIIHKDLELDTRRKGKVHKLTPFHMKNRATNARKLYEEHLAGSRSEYTATLDEAWMYVTYCNGIRKICYIKRGNQVPDNWVHQCSETFPKGFMVVGVMTGRGVLPLIKVPSKVKVNSEFYIECVLKPVIEQLKDLYPGEMDKVFLHHDKASSHTSNKTQQFLQEMKDTLGLNFIRNSDIPVKSPDASPLDFYGFGMLKQRLFNRRAKTEAGLWKAAQEEWSNVSLSKVKEVFAAWKVRCREIAKKKGKHIEHMKKIHVRKIKF
ncbi:USP24 [Cordylochernes scorpioides]|uniref:USP24 n=1 Tax=Cordylochernes scorpioides TaxID=51811 RepID=A0ABY6LE25_9ARAC|nr:USP24 [Cordylochernes scorpioides]